MSLGRLALNSLRFYWRTQLGALLGATIGTAVLVGALAVGDSVRYSLRSLALSRLGSVHFALLGGERFFREDLAGELHTELGVDTASVMALRGTVSSDGGEMRANRVQILGVDGSFWKLGNTTDLLQADPEASVVLNAKLARQLDAEEGDEVLLRIEKPSLLSRDAPLSTMSDSSVTLRLTVACIANADRFGRFSLTANQLAPATAFVSLQRLQERVEKPGKANLLLVGALAGRDTGAKAVTTALGKHLQLGDGDLSLRELTESRKLELRSGRIFLEAPVAKRARETSSDARGVLTYFVNRLQVGGDGGGRSTPYSFVAALDDAPVPEDMSDEEIILNEWLADDLHAQPGDELRLDYFIVGPMRRLIEESRTFRVREIVPLSGAAADADLTPQYPGLVEAENCRDWEPGIPLDLDAIRDKDEAYWDEHHATPKAFVTLAAGQEIWDNRFGNLTSVRYPLTAGVRDEVEQALRSQLRPEFLGFALEPVREKALAAATQALDFGQLFIGLSFFLIVAAVVLTVLLFVFGIEQRTEEVGTLLALGLRAKQVQWLLLLEGGGLAAVGAVLGACCGTAYTRAVVESLNGVWSGAVASSNLQYHATPETLAGGAVGGFFMALFGLWLAIRKQARAPARELLASGAQSQTALLSTTPESRARGLATGIVCVVAALAMVVLAKAGQDQQAAGTFFGAGALLLLGGLALSRALLSALDRAPSTRQFTTAALGIRNTTRRQGRSLATVALLACGTFLVVAVGANRKDPAKGAEKRSSGTGGFALIGDSTMPVYHDLNSPEGRGAFALDEEMLAGVQIVQMRVREGDDSSCLNLNRAQTPRLLGVDPEELKRRHAFAFVQALGESEAGWNMLNGDEGADTVPVVGDQNTVTWGLERKLGDLIPMRDGHGETLYLKIVGVIGGSVLQGNLLVSEQNFVDRFPLESGYRLFLIDVPRDRLDEVSASLSAALIDVGLSLAPAAERLAEFHTVENTYLSIFAILGGLGMVLGSIGLGAVVLRNVLERRAELALLRALGFRRGALKWMVFAEHALLLALGLVVGVVSAVLAVVPALRSPGAEVPVGSLAAMTVAIAVSGVFWTWLATTLSVRGPLLSALRNE